MQKNRLIKNHYFLLFLLLSQVLIFSCEEEEVNKSNIITLNNKNLHLENSIIRNYGQIRAEPTGYNFDITINSSEIIYDTITNHFTGIGSQIHIELFCNSNAVINEGKYYFDVDKSLIPFTFNNSYITDNYNFGSDSGIKYFINQGEIKIIKSEESYILEINCMAQGYSVIGRFVINSEILNRDRFEKLQNYIAFNNRLFDLDYGIRACAGEVTINDDVNFIEMFLYSKTIEFSPTLGFSQSGNLLYFEIFSESYSNIASGTYTFNNSSTAPDPYTFYFGLLFTNFNFSSNNFVGQVIKDGKIYVDYNNVTGIYKINIDCITESGLSVKAQFINRLDFYKLILEKMKTSWGISLEFQY